MPESAAANLHNRDHVVSAEVTLLAGDGGLAAPVEGVLAAQGSGFGGWSLFVQAGRLHYVHNFVALDLTELSAAMPTTPGEHTLGFRFEKSADHTGTGRLVIDAEEVASAVIPTFTPVRWAITGEGLCCGFQFGLPVSRRYQSPFAFTGALRRVSVEVDGPPFVDPAAEADMSMKAQ